MKHLIIKTALVALLISGISACDKKEAKKITTKVDTAVITLNHKTKLQIPVQVCNKPRTDTFKKQSITHYSIVAQSTSKSKNITLLINGVKGKRSDVANYKLELNNQGKKQTFSGKAPYSVFNGHSFHYKGEAFTSDRKLPIEITINCK